MKRFFFLLFLCIAMQPLGAQSLDSLLQAAIEVNPALRAGYTTYQARLKKEIQARQWPEPEAGLSFIAFPFPNRSVMPDATLGLMQPIPWKKALDSKAGIAIAEARMAYEATEMQKLDLRYQIEEAYWQLYELEQSEAVIQRNLELLRIAESLATNRIELGTGSLSEVLDVKMRILELEQQRLQWRNARRAPQAVINQALNRPAATPIAVQAKLEGMAELPVLAAESGLQDYPGLTMLQYNIEASRQQQILNRTESKPSIVTGLDYVVMSKGEGIHATDGRDMLMPRLGVRLPIFRKTYISKDEEEQLLQAALSDQQRELSNSLLTALEKARAQWEDARLQYQLVQEQISLLESSIRLAQSEYSTGGKGLDMLLRYYEQMLMLELKEIQAVSSSYMAQAAVRRLLR